MRAGVVVVATLAVLLMSLSGRSVEAATCSPAGAMPYGPGGSVRADVDGDGTRDRISIAWAAGRTPACRWFLMARTVQGLRATALTQNGLEASYWGGTGRFPEVGRLANVDGRPGVEILVAVDGGASTTAYGFFTVRGSRLLRLRGVRGEFSDAFYEGGSGSGFFSFGCSAPGVMVQSSAGGDHRTGRYSVRRTFHRLSGIRFRYVGSKGYRRGRLRVFPEFSRRPFSRC